MIKRNKSKSPEVRISRLNLLWFKNNDFFLLQLLQGKSFSVILPLVFLSQMTFWHIWLTKYLPDMHEGSFPSNCLQHISWLICRLRLLVRTLTSEKRTSREEMGINMRWVWHVFNFTLTSSWWSQTSLLLDIHYIDRAAMSGLVGKLRFLSFLSVS